MNREAYRIEESARYKKLSTNCDLVSVLVRAVRRTVTVTVYDLVKHVSPQLCCLT